MENLDFLTTIKAMYNNFDFYTLLVNISKDKKILIKFKKVMLREEEVPLIKKGEITLNNIGNSELEFIKLNLENNEELIKKLIFSKFLDLKGDNNLKDFRTIY